MLFRSSLLYFLCLFAAAGLYAQKISGEIKQAVDTTYRLFDDDDILHFTLTAKLASLYSDRTRNISYHPVLLQYKADTGIVSFRLSVKTRGNFRRIAANCKMPPLMLSFPKTDKIKGSVFQNQKKLKLVVPCQGDEYVVREWLVYKLYNLVTDKSFKARLVLVDFEDSLRKRATETHYCILLEDESRMAARNRSFVWNAKMQQMQNMERSEFTKMAVFQYMIGNTDWSVPYLQNIKLIKRDSAEAPFAVPYDFDHAGIVDAPYARPAPELEINSIRDRLYRGYCERDTKLFAATFDLFNKHKDDFYKLYADNALLSGRYIRSAIKFLDDFYKIINTDRLIRSEFGKPCLSGTRIEIKGLKQ